MSKIETREEWYRANDCSHAHCPFECEHPQPFVDEEELLCGRCWFKFGERTIMIPCIPEICD